MFSTFSIYMTDALGLTKADVGLLYSINGIGVLLLQMPALALIRRLGIAQGAAVGVADRRARASR